MHNQRQHAQVPTRTTFTPLRWYARREFHFATVFVLGMLSTFALAILSPPIFNEIYRILSNLTN